MNDKTWVIIRMLYVLMLLASGIIYFKIFTEKNEAEVSNRLLIKENAILEYRLIRSHSRYMDLEKQLHEKLNNLDTVSVHDKLQYIETFDFNYPFRPTNSGNVSNRFPSGN